LNYGYIIKPFQRIEKDKGEQTRRLLSRAMAVKVAVIGAGGVGLSATKTFIEDGFDATTYESGEYYVPILFNAMHHS
jgi:NADPH-dependent 2,4-dienoyl-CoA reductase/sulfur reductase-like enzyme